MTYIIAEFGTGHAHPDPYKRYALAVAGIMAARNAGADAVKFQLFTGADLFCPLPGDAKRWPRWRETFLSFEQWEQIKRLADQTRIDFLLSAFDHEGVDWCRRLALRFYKVASRAAKTYPYDKVPGPFIVSTGMLQPGTTIGPFDPPRVPDIHFLECTSQYPTPLENARWSGKFDGLSDHSGTPWPGVDAIVRGAKFLEVHFTIPGATKSNDPNVQIDDLRWLCDTNAGIARLQAPADSRHGGDQRAQG